MSDWALDLGDRSETVRIDALRALVSSGDDGVAFALEALHDPDWLARKNGLGAVFLLSGCAAERSVYAISVSLKDPDLRVREEAAKKLHELVRAALEALARKKVEGEGAEGPRVYEPDYGKEVRLSDWQEVRKALPALIEALKDSHPDVRFYAALALGACGPEGTAAEPGLESLLSDPSFDVRLAAAVALLRCGKEGSKEFVPPSLFLEAIGEERRERLDWELVHQVPLALAALGSRAKDAVPMLSKIAEGSDPTDDNLRAGSIEALGILGPLAKDAIPALEQAASDKNFEEAARAALQKIRGGK